MACSPKNSKEYIFKNFHIDNHEFPDFNGYYLGPSRAFSGRGICHFLRRDFGKLDFKIAGNGIRFTHGTENFLIFLLGKREKYEMIAWYRDK